MQCLPKWKLLNSGSFISPGGYIALGRTSADASCATDPSTRADGSSADTNSAREWLKVSGDLATSLGIDPPNATEAEHRRVFDLYLRVFFWIKTLLAVSFGGEDNDTDSDPRRSAVVLGVSAPQGCGKTTLVEEMKRMLDAAGYPCAVLSIDDFYLTRAEQVNMLLTRKVDGSPESCSRAPELFPQPTLSVFYSVSTWSVS